MRVYSSFEEIDKDLKILRLQTEIDKEEIKLSLDETKSKLSPVSLAGSMVGTIIQKALVLKAVSKIFGVKRVVTSSRK
ncbi:MAG: DUF6327 family protein [Bacteroidota bacterium]|uniref:Uncharacterized protein n=1 Tax=Christiangramia flava JLT2011 TaxID=1229726 RepID=A0A1L7I4T0_9FLAO|nr:DUF6327 family protein [Christiangramia flava]APU68102.1 hypothetical protein GRFL_1378 [Christiangramia flava JLT2011]MAM18236.1 hypothetical protein [Christiangramia sp.]MEE2771471.1 DUF6327 family protein [Bacteroidota bacterium]OSS37618.1 hypothetical protein C723_3457 [Christiangramia flava JLT2011]|tara:strand:- start:326 stop:559 length:234 start_codon:yes stop_codon:yes gene_type:complete